MHLLGLFSHSRFVLYVFPVIALLTVALTLLRIHEVVGRFLRDKDRARLVFYLGTIAIVASILINVAYRVVDKVIETDSVVGAARAADVDPG